MYQRLKRGGLSKPIGSDHSHVATGLPNEEAAAASNPESIEYKFSFFFFFYKELLLIPRIRSMIMYL